MELCTKRASTLFRKEEYVYTSYYYRCVDTGRAYTDKDLDNKSLEHVYSQYRKRHGIPSREEIKAIREQYGLSALAMSRILGLGDNQYRLYEEGAIPSESAGKLLSLVRQKVNMLALLEASKELLSLKEFNRFFETIKNAPVPIVFPIIIPQYSHQSYSEEKSGQMISKRVTKTPYFKMENYEIAVND